MIKKIFLILVLLIGITGCKTDKDDDMTSEYILGAREVIFFDELNTEVKNRLFNANLDENPENYQIDMIGKDMPDFLVEDIYGHDIVFDGEDTVLFVLSVNCSHCQDMIKNDLNDILDNHNDKKIMLYFDVGIPSEIRSFFNTVNVEIPDIPVIYRNEKMHKYLVDYLNIVYYPTMILYHNKSITFASDSRVGIRMLNRASDIGFKKPLKRTDLINEKGISVFELSRTKEDVLKEFSLENLNKLKELSGDELTLDILCRKLALQVDYDSLVDEVNSSYISEINDFGSFKDKDTVVIYLMLEANDKDLETISMINDFIMDNPDISVIPVLIEGQYGSSELYKTMGIKIKAPAVSMLSKIPEAFLSSGFAQFPSALFIEKSTISGAYSSIDSADKLNYAASLFFGDNSVVLKKNN